MMFVLPGMGADSGMFTGSWKQLPDAVFIDWPPYQKEHTLTEIAAKLIAKYGITDGATVVGTSLGGMVACEIAKLRRLHRLVLIGSAVHPDEINSLLTLLKPLSPFAPVDWLQWSAASVPSELTGMFSRSDPDFIRASIQAVFKWEGINSSLPPPVRIHGRNDPIIPPPLKVDLLIEGGHLIAMSHAKLCCDYILKTLSHEPSTQS